MQLDLFDILYEDFKFEEPIRAITCFSGIGFQEMGMDLAEIPKEKIMNFYYDIENSRILNVWFDEEEE